MKRIFTGAAAPALLVALLLAGCGSSSSNSQSAPSQASSGSQGSGSQGSGYSAAPGKSVTVTTKHDKLGTVLAAGSKDRTVYLFEADKTSKSNCMSACASNWPPVVGKPKATSKARSTDLSTIMRPDGQPQVTYKGHPLYYYVRDKDAGDIYGQGLKAFGAEWYVLAPSGNKVESKGS